MTIYQNTDMHDEYDLTELDKKRFLEEQQRGMVTPQDPCLSQIAREIQTDNITSAYVTGVVRRLREAANGQRRTNQGTEKRRTLVGLAAPQIGESCRVILIDTKITEARKSFGKMVCIINPVIVWRTREKAEGREGCFSAGPVWGLVRRPVAVKVSGYDPTGRKVQYILEDFSARVACHEIDHLDGIRFPERIASDKKRHWVHTEELPQYPDMMKRWPRLCSLVRWEQFKNPALSVSE
ncbi:MAG TPA: peptide deformylase [Patescibacteria group bacterium]|nr:peptide deformylase [Patescibacteria group bacterium]